MLLAFTDLLYVCLLDPLHRMCSGCAQNSPRGTKYDEGDLSTGEVLQRRDNETHESRDLEALGLTILQLSAVDSPPSIFVGNQFLFFPLNLAWFCTQDRSPKTQSQVRRMIEAGQVDRRAPQPPSPPSSAHVDHETPLCNAPTQSPTVEKGEIGWKVTELLISP